MCDWENEFEDGSCKRCGWLIDVDKKSFRVSAKEKSKKPCYKCLERIVEFSNKVWNKTISEDSYVILEQGE